MELKKMLKIGFVYLSGVIGAGFITGREIYSYFGKFGIKGFAGIAVSTLLFAVTAYKLIAVISEKNCSDLRETAEVLFGKKLGDAVCAAVAIFLYCMYVVIAAGAAELLQNYIGFNRFTSAVIITLTAVLLLATGFERIASVCAVAAPLTAVVMILVLVVSGNFQNLITFAKMSCVEGISHRGNYLWVVSSVIYCGYNLLVLLSVLPRVIDDSCSTKAAKAGGVFGALFVGILLFIVNAGMFGASLSERLLDMPLLSAAVSKGGFLQILMVSAVLITMVLSCAVNLSNCGREFAKVIKSNEKTAGLFLAMFGGMLSFVGFGTLMDIFYNFFGIFGVILIIPLVFTRK